MNHEVDNRLPLTPAQEHLVVRGAGRAESAPAPVQQVRWVLHGPLDEQAYAGAWQDVVDRHDALRSSIDLGGLGGPLHVVHREVECPIRWADVRELSDDERVKQVEALAESDRLDSWDPTVPPLLRLSVGRVADEVHHVAFTFHRAALDERSMVLVLSEVAAAYAARRSGAPLGSEPASQYGDFVRWLEKQDAVAGEQAWERRLAGLETPTRMVLASRRDVVEDGLGACREVLVPDVAQRVHALAAADGVAPASVVAAAWALVLARYAGRHDVVFGACGPQRPADVPGVESMAGPLEAVVPVRVALDAGTTVRGLVREVDAAVRAGLDGAPVRLPPVLAAVGLLSDEPLFDSVVRFGTVPSDEVQRAVGGSPLRVDSLSMWRAPDTPLALAFHEQEGVVELAFRSEALDRVDVERTAARLVQVLDRMTEDPGRSVAEVPITTDAEAVAARSWNDTSGEVDTRPVHEQVVARAAGRPDAVAVLAGGTRLTYRELVERSSRLAHHLVSLGVQPDSFVGVLVPRAADMPVAMLGALLAGAAYVPLDPAYPADRVQFMLADSGADIVVTSGDWAFDLGQATPRLVRLDHDARELSAHPPTPPAVAVRPEQSAYAIYTSGSTGRPKGAVVEHRNLSAFLAWATSAFGEDELRTVAASTSICFDLSVYELFTPLCTGGTVVIVDDALQLAEPQPAALSLANTVPSAVEALLRSGRPPRSIGTVNLAGEPLSSKVVEELLAGTGTTRVGNLYGPSETTIYSTAAFFDAAAVARRDWESPPIGRPIANTTAWVLDDFGHPVPPGVPGELYIGGACVGRGYHRRPGLTAERFVPDPFATAPGARLYRTGDVVRQRPDGNLEFIGRRDHQVKVRGYRVELPEIEAALLSHAAVREAAVVVTGATAAEHALAAFVVAEPAPRPAELQRHIAQRLPSYMVPQMIVALDDLPRTPNGKLDRAALLRIDLAEAASVTTAATPTPRTPTAEVLASIWSAVLGVERVGADDDFFHLGGQSLLAMQVVARVRDALGVELPLPVLFERRTLSAVAAELDGARSSRRSSPVVPRGRRQGRASMAQRAVLQTNDPDDAAAVAPVYRLTGSVDVEALERALNEIAQRHESLRTVYRRRLRAWRQVVLPWTPIPLEVEDVRTKAKGRGGGGGVQQALVANTTEPFDLHNGPVVRWKLFRLGKQEHLLSIVIHEIAADGWSLPTLETELAALYADFAQGRPASLPPPQIQYLDYALWQKKSMNRAVRRGQLQYWKEKLRDAPLGFDLVPDLWVDDSADPVAGEARLPLEPELTEKLRAFARDEGATLFMVLFAAYVALLHRCTGSDQVLLRPAAANRTTAEVEPIIGFFVNHLLLGSDVSGDPSLREMVSRVRQEFLEAAVNSGLPLTEVLQRTAAMKTAHAQWPAGVMRFQHLNFPHDQELRLPGLRVQPEPQGAAVSDHLALFGFEQSNGAVEYRLFYDAARYSRGRMTQLVSRFHDILRSMVETPDVRVSDLPLLDRRETDAALRAGRGGSHAAPSMPVHELVAEVARKTPDAHAVVAGEERLTYGELDRRADEVAAGLRAAGVGTEDAVVLAVSSPGDRAVGLLGVLKAGGVCVPLDRPSDEIARHAGARVVLTDESLDSMRGDRSTAAGASSVEALDTGALALYCNDSGEGLRAAVLDHRALAHLATWQAAAAGLRRTDRVAELPPRRHSRLPWSLLSTLTAGATYVSPDAIDSSIDQWLVEQKATVCVGGNEATKACASMPKGSKASLRLVLTDEPAFVADGRLPVQVRELWGAAETGGVSAVADGPRVAAAPAFSGAPIAEADLYVLDGMMNLMPPFEVGEVYVGGDYLARGYLGDPRATAERFVPDPFSAEAGRRLYRTGSVGRVGAKGRVEILRRTPGADTARGVPAVLHLQRIEADLLAHPEVRGAVVRIEPVLGEPRVKAYVCTVAGARLGRRELAKLLPDDLPAWAKPASIDVLDDFPRRPDGSVDPGRLGKRK